MRRSEWGGALGLCRYVEAARGWCGTRGSSDNFLSELRFLMLLIESDCV